MTKTPRVLFDTNGLLQTGTQFVRSLFFLLSGKVTRFTTYMMSGKCTQHAPLCGHQHP
jgi:hypothetical protein